MGVENGTSTSGTALGMPWERLLDRVGSVEQIAAATPMTLSEGPAAGVRALDVRTIDGLDATVLLDRGMNVAQAWYRGAPLAWVSPTGPAHPAFAAGGDWLSTFHGGLLVTCGTQNIGPACEVDGIRHPEHGALSNTPAQAVHWFVETDPPAIVVEGTVREVRALGVHVELRRRLCFEVASPRLRVEDVFANRGERPVPLMLLYHLNFGWPVVSEASSLFGWPTDVRPHPDAPAAATAIGEHDRFEPPTPDWPVQVFEHLGEATGGRTIGIANPEYGPTDGLAVAVTYDPAELPCLWRWRMFGRRNYVVGIEPSTCPAMNREKALLEGIPLPTLQPDEEHRVTLRFEASVGETARALAAA